MSNPKIQEGLKLPTKSSEYLVKLEDLDYVNNIFFYEVGYWDNNLKEFRFSSKHIDSDCTVIKWSEIT